MKKIAILLTLAAVLLTACNQLLPEEEPTEQEQQMVPEEMTWKLDSVLVINNYRMINESRQMLHPEDGIDIWSYTLYPCTFSFPEDLYFTSEYSGEKIYLQKEFNKSYCKFTCTYENSIVSGGYLCYYKDYFTFSGVSSAGWMVFMIREADTNWDADVWTCAYNAEEDYDTGAVIERRIEYYSRVR